MGNSLVQQSMLSTLWNGLLYWRSFNGNSADSVGGSTSSDTAMSYPGVAQVFNMPFVNSGGSGYFKLSLAGAVTAAIQYSATYSTLISNINAALNAAFGSGNVVAGGTSLSSIQLTLSGSAYLGLNNGPLIATIQSGATGFTICGLSGAGIPFIVPTQGPFGVKAASFNGSTSVIKTSMAIPAGSFTFAICFIPGSVSANQILAAQDAGTSPTFQRAFDLEITGGGGLEIDIWNTAQTHYSITNSATFYAGRAEYLVFYWDAVNNLAGVYQKGSLQHAATAVSGTPLQSTDTFNFGARDYSGSALPFTGQILRAGMWNRVLTAAEANTLWNGDVGLDLPFQIPASIPIVTVSASSSVVTGPGYLSVYEAQSPYSLLGVVQTGDTTNFHSAHPDGVHALVCCSTGSVGLQWANSRTLQVENAMSGLTSQDYGSGYSPGGPIESIIPEGSITTASPLGTAFIASWVGNTAWGIDLSRWLKLWTCNLASTFFMDTISISPDGSKIVVNDSANSSGAGFAVIETSNGVASTVAGQSGRVECGWAGISPDSAFVYAAYVNGDFDIFSNSAGYAFVANVPSFTEYGEIYEIVFNPVNAKGYATSYGENGLLIIDFTNTAEPVVTGVIPFGTPSIQPSGEVLLPDNSTLWVANFADGTAASSVAIVNTTSESLVGIIAGSAYTGNLWAACDVDYFGALGGGATSSSGVELIPSSEESESQGVFAS